jgi:hypothetical protein
MRNRIDVSTVEFRVMGFGPRPVSKNDKSQKMTGDRDPKGNRPIWSVRLMAYDTETDRSEQIFVEVAGDEPQLANNKVATIVNLTYEPWAAAEQVNGQWKGKIMRSYRADSIVMADGGARRAA